MTVLSLADEQRLIVNFLRTRGPVGATKDEMTRVVEWAVQARVDGVLLTLVLSGEVSIDVAGDGEIVFTKGTLGEMPRA